MVKKFKIFWGTLLKNQVHFFGWSFSEISETNILSDGKGDSTDLWITEQEKKTF